MRRDDLYVADLADTTRAIREYLDSISRAQWDEDRRNLAVHRYFVVDWAVVSDTLSGTQAPSPAPDRRQLRPSRRRLPARRVPQGPVRRMRPDRACPDPELARP